ncbi:MAG TPA: hypothetical protein VL688_06065 [Verrucomicrobiae bacterium]|nr:hypothetical protein [Verrucomicrobiae bacterium]
MAKTYGPIPLHASLRLVSVIFVVVLKKIVPGEFDRVFVSVGFAHYALALWYSQKQMGHVLSRQVSTIAAAFLAAAGAAVTYYNCPSIALYFGVHHALSDSYLFPREPRPANMKPLLASRFVFNLAGYAILLHQDPSFRWLPLPAMIAALLVSFAASLVCLWKLRPAMAPGEFRDQLLFDIVGLAVPLILLSQLHVFQGRRVFRPLVLYHFVFWNFIPAMKMAKTKHAKALTRYAAETAAVTLLFFLMTLKISKSLQDSQIILWGYIHITASFALSSLNPSWIRKWFSLPAPPRIVMKPT